MKDVASSVQLNSQLDTDFADTLRQDVWNKHFWTQVVEYLNMRPYPFMTKWDIVMNIFDCAFERALPLQMIVDGKRQTVVKDVLIVPSVHTIASLVKLSPVHQLHGKGMQPPLKSASDFKEKLDAKCRDGTPSWIDQFETMFKDPSKWADNMCAQDKNFGFQQWMRWNKKKFRNGGMTIENGR